MARGRPLGKVVDGQMYRGVLTGLNAAFIIDTATRDQLIREDPTSAEIITSIVRGEDLRPWYQEDKGRYLIVLKSSGDYHWPWSGAGEDAEEIFRHTYPSLHAHMKPLEERLRKRQDKGRYWWELRKCSYYSAFAKPKVFWPDISRFPRFSWDSSGVYVNDKGYFVVFKDSFVLGLLHSRAAWLCISKLCVPLGERAGANRYQQKAQFVSRIPIPEASAEDHRTIGAVAMQVTEHARARYELHKKTSRRILSDLGVPGKKLNQKLTAWWNLDFPGFRAEIEKFFKKDIPLAERDEWEEWLARRRAENEWLTSEILRLETELNAHVYGLFDLMPDEITTIEESTGYSYGEV